MPGLGPAYRGYTWMYDKNFVIRSYSFSDLDMARRCSPRFPRLWGLGAAMHPEAAVSQPDQGFTEILARCHCQGGIEPMQVGM